MRNEQRKEAAKQKEDESFMNTRQRNVLYLVLHTAAHDAKGNDGDKMCLMLCGSVSDVNAL